MSDTDTSTEADDREEEDDDPVETAKARFAICEEAWAENRRLALEDLKFARLEEQWPENIRRDRERDGRPCLTLNQLHSFIFQVVNDARQNKPGITVHPVGDGADPETAELYNGLIRHIEQSSDADVAYDTGMDAAVSSGFGFLRINTRYACDDNFDQDLVIERIADHLSVYPDPHSTAADSSDWNECFILESITKKAFKKRWKGKEAVSFDEVKGAAREVSDEDMVQIAEVWTRDVEKRTIVALSPVPAEGDPAQLEQARAMVPDNMIVGMEVYQEHKDLFDALGVSIVGQPREVESHKVTQRICSGADELEKVEWAGKYIPIVPIYGEELNVEGKRILRSLHRGAHDAQRMFNYWRTTTTELVALAPKTPFIGKKGAFETDAAKWATANTQTHAYIEFDGQDAPERQAFAGPPSGALQESASAQNDIMSIIGIYKASLGAQSNEDSGVAINARDRQADTGTFHFIDNLSRAIRHAGRILLDLIPKVYSTPRMLRILHPDGTPDMVQVNQPFHVPQIGPDGKPVTDPQTGELIKIEKLFDLTVGKYDLIVKAGPSFASQREEMVSKLTELVRADPKLAPILADLIVDNYDIPDAEKIVQRIQALQPQGSPELAQAKDQLAKLGQALQQAQMKIAGLSSDRATDAKEVDIDAFKAETERLKAILGKDGANPGIEAMMPVVAAIMHQVMTSPDPFGTLQAMAGNGAPGIPPQGPGSAPPQGQPQGFTPPGLA